MAQTTVRRATLEDVAFLSQAMHVDHLQEHPDSPNEGKASWIEGAMEATREQVLGQVRDSVTYVIQVRVERVGRLRVVRTSDRHFVAGIQIVPDHQGEGIGTAVITDLLQEARKRRVPLELKVSKNNPNAERLYLRLGFRRSGEEGNDYCMTTGSI